MSGRRSPPLRSISALEADVACASKHLRSFAFTDNDEIYGVSFKHGRKTYELSVAKDCPPGLLEHAKRGLLESTLRDIRERFTP